MPMDIIESSSGNCYCKRSDGNMDVGISIAFYDIGKLSLSYIIKSFAGYTRCAYEKYVGRKG